MWKIQTEVYSLVQYSRTKTDIYTFSTLSAPLAYIIEALDAVLHPYKLFIHTLCIQGPIVEPLQQLPYSGL